MSKEVEFKGVKYSIKKPTRKDLTEAQITYNKAFSWAIENKFMLSEELDKYLEQKGVWTKDKQVEYKTLTDKIQDNVSKINRGGFKFKDAVEMALEVTNLRSQISTLIAEKNKYSSNCVEGYAHNSQFDFLTSRCCCKEDGSLVWATIDDYMTEPDEELVVFLASSFADYFYDLDNNLEKTLPENKFLVKYKVVDENLNFINKDGHKTDREGRLIDENNRFIKYVDDQKVFVNRNGEEIDEDGNLLQSSPFLDDDGNPITV